MEYGGRWKPLHYAVRRIYAPLALSWYKTGTNLFSHAVSDLATKVEVELVYSIVWLDENKV